DDAQGLVAQGGKVGPLDPAGDALYHLGDLDDPEQHDQANGHDDAGDHGPPRARRRGALAQSPVDAVVHRAEQVGDDRGHHDENEIVPQEVRAEQNGDDRGDGQGSLLCQREFGIHGGHWSSPPPVRLSTAYFTLLALCDEWVIRRVPGGETPTQSRTPIPTRAAACFARWPSM